jgi:CheY-like chemotaxis protein
LVAGPEIADWHPLDWISKMYNIGCCSNTMSLRYLPASMDFSAAQRLLLMHAPYEYIPAPSPSTVRVLIAGDHATLRASLKTMLELDPRIKVVGDASDDCETVKMARKLRPDVLLVDLDMRCCDDFEAVAEITEKKLATSVIGLTIYDDQAERTKAQAAGVDLFLEKGVPYKQLINAIRLAAVKAQTP